MKPKYLFSLIILIAIFSHSNCTESITPKTDYPELPKYYYLKYDISLWKVEKPSMAKEKAGNSQITNNIYEDEFINISWAIDPLTIAFTLLNKTDHSLKIIWDEAVFVDPIGRNHRIFHSGVRYIDRNAPQPPSIIVRKGQLTDTIYPTDYVHFSDEWEEEPILPYSESGGDPELLFEEGKLYIGSTIQILLPLEINGKINEYIFVFKINDVTLKVI